MRSKMIRGLVAASAVALGVVAGGGVAQASSSDPTAGDFVEYVFYSDVKYNGSSTWYDADNDQSSFDNTTMPKVNSSGHWYGTQRFTSRSTYQMVAASIQTDGYYAACQVYVNGVLVGTDSARGHYAMAVC